MAPCCPPPSQFPDSGFSDPLPFYLTGAVQDGQVDQQGPTEAGLPGYYAPNR